MIYGLLVSVALAVASYFSLRWAISRSHHAFVNMLFGGMTARLIILGGVTAVVWKFFPDRALGFTVTLLGSYVIFQIIEVIVAQKQLQRFKMDSLQTRKSYPHA
jgi:hypothetical protein